MIGIEQSPSSWTVERKGRFNWQLLHRSSLSITSAVTAIAIRVRCVTKEDLTDAPRVGVPQLIILLIHVSHALDRCPPGDVLLNSALRALALRLNISYLAAGAPYGDEEAGFRRWLYERWPAPPVA
jgi:hypothetical protein